MSSSRALPELLCPQHGWDLFFSWKGLIIYGSAPKERRRRRAQKRLSKRVFLESPFLLCPLKVFRTFQVFLRTNLKGAEKKRTLQKHPFGQPFLHTTPSPLLWRTLNSCTNQSPRRVTPAARTTRLSDLLIKKPPSCN